VQQRRCLFLYQRPLKSLLTLHDGSRSAVRNALRNSIILKYHVGTCRHVHSQVETCSAVLDSSETKTKAQSKRLQIHFADALTTNMAEHGCKHQKGPGFASPLVRDMQIVET